MDKSRNNEVHAHSTGRRLIAIEKNDNVLEKTKNSYVKRSFYSMKYKDSPSDKVRMRKVISCKNNKKCNSGSNEYFSRAKVTSTPLTGKASLPIVLKVNNSFSKSPSCYTPSINHQLKDKLMQKKRHKINELFLTAKLNHTSKVDHSKDFNRKCLIYIEDLINKRKGNKAKSFNNSLKEAEMEQRLFYYDQELPLQYKNPSSDAMPSIKVRKDKSDKSHSSTIRIKFCDKQLNSISRRVNLYNERNEYIREEEVANKLHGGIAAKNKGSQKSACINTTKAKREHSFILKDFEIDPQVLFPQCSPSSNYKDIIHNKKHMQNRLIKKELNRTSTTSLYKSDQYFLQEHIEGDNIYSKQNNSKEEEETKILSNKVDKDESNELSLHTLTSKYIYGSLIHSPVNNVKLPFNANENNSNLNEARNSVQKKSSGEIQDTVRTVGAVQPKGLNVNIIKQKSSASQDKNQLLQVKEINLYNTINRRSIDIQRRIDNLSSPPTKDSLMRQQIKEACIRTIFGDSSSVAIYLNNSSIFSCANKNPFITKIKRKKPINKPPAGYRTLLPTEEEAKRKKEESIEMKKANEKRREEEEEHWKLISEQEKVEQLNEEYLGFVRRKNAEEEARQRQKHIDKELAVKLIEEYKARENKEAKLSYFSFLNSSKDETIKTNALPKEKIRKSMIVKRDLLQGHHIDMSEVKKNKLKQQMEQENFEKKFKLKKEAIEEEKVEKEKRQRAILKLKQEINYVLQENEEDEDSIDKDKISANEGALNDFKGKLESLKQVNEQAFVKYLENNFEEIQEEMANLKLIRDDEKRINSFLQDMDNSLNNTRERKKCLKSRFKIIDSKCSYSASSVFQ